MNASIPKERRFLYVIFGIVLPILCLAFDPGVMTGKLSSGLAAEAPLFVYGTAALGMFAMLAWLVVGGRSSALDAVLAGILFVAGIISGLVGLFLLPMSLIGLLFFIGLFGFIPFATAWAFLNASNRALGSGNSKPRWAAALVGGALILVLAGGYERLGDAVIDEAAAPFKLSESSGGREAAIRRLARWRFLLPDGAIGRRAARFSDIDAEAFALHYREVTGVDLRLWGRMGGD